MVFSSVPGYLDAPSWNQQPLHQLPAAAAAAAAGGDASHQLLPGLGAARSEDAAMAAAAAGATAMTRPISMTERARLAKIVPQPELPLKCPRCDSTNTKFCYFNNYSLTQPRHFCKTCRRYWTRGGALRNVPVGGGCRRNKLNKSSSSSGSSKSTAVASAAADRQAAGASSSSSAALPTGGVIAASITHPGQLPFLTSMHTLASGGAGYGGPDLGLNFSGFPSLDATAEYQVARNSSSSAVGLDQWRLPQIQQFPLLGGAPMEPPPPLYHFNVDGGSAASSGVLPKTSGSSLISQLASVKMEDSNILPRHLYLGLAGNVEQYSWSSAGNAGEGGSSACWGSTTTTDLSGFNSSSSGNIL